MFYHKVRALDWGARLGVGAILWLSGVLASAAPPPPEVGVITVQTQAVVLTSELPGRVLAFRVAEVRPQVGGLIRERLFEEGATVKLGQALYRIDPARYEAARDRAAAALARARAVQERARLKAERYANLLKANSISQEDHDDVQAALKEATAELAVAEAELARAKLDLDDTLVKAPLTGIIGRSNVTQGALVAANQEQALATVRQIDPIYVDFTQASQALLRVRRALDDGRLQRAAAPRVTLLLEDGSRYRHAGQLEFAEAAVDPATGSVTLRARFPNPDHLLLPGMFVRALVEEGIRPDALLVPQQGVSRDRRGQPVAWVLNSENLVEQRVLVTERMIGQDWLIDAGLQPGERVIVEGTQKIRPGAPARAAAITPASSP